jgi:glycosyltransferase involved in cell wall biosynthesis
MRMGGQRSIASLIEHLDRTVVEPLAIVPNPGELADQLRAFDCPVVHIPLYKIKPRTLSGVWNSSRQIRGLLLQRKVDIIAPDAARDAFTCGLAKLGTMTRMVWFVRLTSRDRLDHVNQFLADGIIGVSGATQRRFWRPRRARHRTIFEGADLRVFRPVDDRAGVRARLGLPRERFVALYAGQVRMQKGVLDILDAWALLKRELSPQRMPLLVVIGTAVESGIRERIDAHIRAGQLTDDVRVMPHQSGIQEWMQATDVLVSGSHEHTEGLSRVLYEAMACGATVIATDIAGNREAFTPDTGILVPQKSPPALANAVRALVDTPERRALLRERAIRRAREAFDICHHARAVEQFFLEVRDGVI